MIEAGYPAIDRDGGAAVMAAARATRRATICAMARADRAEIEAAAAALAPARGRARIHLYDDLRPDRAFVDAARDAVARARDLVDEVQYTPRSGATHDQAVTGEAVAVAVERGATCVGIADTFGRACPDEVAAMVAWIAGFVGDRARISFHGHDHLGMAVANALAAVRAGARQIEGTVAGVGPSGGNLALDRALHALVARRDRFPSAAADAARVAGIAHILPPRAMAAAVSSEPPDEPARSQPRPHLRHHPARRRAVARRAA